MKKTGLIALAFSAGLLASVSMAETRAYPVPFVAKDDTDIVFTDLPGSGNIRIFTVNGDEVATLSIQPGQNVLHWPVTNSSGKKVASGVYFYLVDGAGTSTRGKLVVIR
jgi:hypothetical protein